MLAAETGFIAMTHSHRDHHALRNPHYITSGQRQSRPTSVDGFAYRAQSLLADEQMAELVSALYLTLLNRDPEQAHALRQELPSPSRLNPRCLVESPRDEQISLSNGRTKADLTTQQLALLRHIDSGAQNNLIAERMRISPNTVKWHLKRLYRRLGVHNRCTALRRARSLGLIR